MVIGIRQVRAKIVKRAYCQCENWNHPKCKCTKGMSIHHIIANTNMNAKLYGDDFLQSEDNGMLLCSYCHDHQAEMELVQRKKSELLEKLNTEKST